MARQEAFDFEEFSPGTARKSADPKLTLQKGGTISLNSAAVEKLRRAGEKDEDQIPVVFLYDARKRLVAIKRVEKSPNQYLIRKQPNSTSFLVSAAAFARHHGIDTSEARRYDARLFGKDMIGFGLDDRHETVARDKDK